MIFFGKVGLLLNFLTYTYQYFLIFLKCTHITHVNFYISPTFIILNEREKEILNNKI